MNIRLSGAICGHLWMPQSMAGILGDWNISREKKRITSSNGDPILIADAINLILNENGSDFQDALFTGDTEIIFEFKRPTARGYTYHCRNYLLSDCPSLSNYVSSSSFISDFFNDDNFFDE